jgi:hypothetical protein
MNATGIVYPQYWVQPEVALMFPAHLQILKLHYCCRSSIEPNAKSHASLLDHVLLEQQSNFFMTTMQSNSEVAMKPPHYCNPTIQMWKRFAFSVIVKDRIFEYFKLVELIIVAILGSVENEQFFSIVSFMKSKLRNRLTTNMDMVVRMYAQDFFALKTFRF